MLFPKKRYAVLISKDRIDPGLVVLKKEPVFRADPALPYSAETLAAVLSSVRGQAGRKKVRIVLSEELVYVTELMLPAGSVLSRESIRQEAEASIPEDLSVTDWDFQTAGYAAKEGDDGKIAIQVVAVAASFSRIFREALLGSGLHAESIVPESYALSTLLPSEAMLQAVVARIGDRVTAAIIRNGFVVASETKPEISSGDLESLVAFAERRTGMALSRLICSGVDGSLFSRPSETYDLNPLFGAVFADNISGDDEETLNLIQSMPSR